MSLRINVEKAGESESFGALAVGRRRYRRRAGSAILPCTAAQKRAICELTRSLVKFAKEVGASTKIIRLGEISLELHRKGAKEVLSITKAATS